MKESRNQLWNELSEKAWKVRENASVFGSTKVGCALIGSNKIFVGCNIEQQFRNKDIHAEVNAISNMISSGVNEFHTILIVAERDRFTPCGTCMDWIFQFGGESVEIGFQNVKNGPLFIKTAKELMPYYPK